MAVRGGAYAGLLSALVVALTGCSGADPVRQSAEQAGSEAGAGPDRPTAEPSGDPSPLPSPAAGPTPIRAASASPTPTSSPLALPSGPATRPASPRPPAPGSLATVDWDRYDHDAACARPAVGGPVVGDLDGDRVDEVAVPLTCPDKVSSVLVYAGDAAAPRLVGDALPPEERAEVQGVQVRGEHLVVGARAYSGEDRSGEPDLAVTARWVVESDTLVRTDRWEDPAYVLEVDEGQ